MNRLSPVLAALLVAAGAAWAVACTGAAQPAAVPAAPAVSGGTPAVAVAPPSPAAGAAAPLWPAPRPIELPADDAAHPVLTEWWYYHGHLQSESGTEYGFQLVVFKRRGLGGRAGYVAHAAVTDHERGTFQFQQELSLPPPAAPPVAGFDLTVGPLQARGNAGSDELRGRTADYAFTLQLTPLKPPVLHGVTGYIGVSPAELSYYYTRPRLAVSGTLTAHGQPHAVTGLAWMDHQWGDFSLEGPGGWDWAGLQLSDGTDLMVSVLRDGGGRTVLAYGTLVTAAGAARHLAGDALRLRATGQWTSPGTGISYPSGWELDLPAAGARLELVPVLPEQELDTRDTTGRVYWEGQVRVQGTTAAGPVHGRGYVELTGYGPGPG